jgi:hypothetical protein
LLAGRPSDEAASDEATMINHVRVTNIARNANRKIPVSHMYPPGIGPGSLMTEAIRWTTGPVVELYMNAVRFLALHN